MSDTLPNFSFVSDDAVSADSSLFSSPDNSQSPPFISIATFSNKRRVSSQGIKLADKGRHLAISSAVLWFALNNGGMIYQIGRFAHFAKSQSTAKPQSIIDSMTNDVFGLWFIATIGQLCAIGVVVGIIMMIVGYANLFLEKQSVFKQHINEQMNVVATAAHVVPFKLQREQRKWAIHTT